MEFHAHPWRPSGLIRTFIAGTIIPIPPAQSIAIRITQTIDTARLLRYGLRYRRDLMKSFIAGVRKEMADYVHPTLKGQWSNGMAPATARPMRLK
jgi:hypothetical protein